MNTLGWILIILGTFVLSATLTFFIAKKYMIKYMKNNLDFNDQMIEMAMAQMGGKVNKKQMEKIKKGLQQAQAKDNKKNKK